MDAAHVCLQKALAVEAEGGMLTADNKQRRTPGGTYFYIVRSQLTPEQRSILWPRSQRPSRSQPTPKPPAAAKAPSPAIPARPSGRQPKPPCAHPILPWDARETLTARPWKNKEQQLP